MASSSTHQKALLKVQLLNSFNTLGFHEELKKQLRVQICQKLKQKNLIKANLSHQDKLYNRVMASLISQYLTISDCGYSNSIYVAESGYDMKTLDRNQIIQVIGLSQNQLQAKFSILENIIKRKFPFSGGTLRTIGIQTNPQNIGYSLQQKLALIDKQYRNNMVSNTNKDELDYKKKLEQVESDLKRNFERDLQRFKQFETHNIKIKVSQQWRKKFQQYSKNISQQYRRKFDNLRKRQRFLEDDIVNKKKVLDQKVNGTNKTLLQKIDILDIKSSTVQETRRNLQIERKRIKQQYSQIEKQVKVKSREYDNLLLNLNEKIQYEVNVAKLAIQQQYQQKNAEFLNRKKYIDQEYGKLMGIKQASDLIKQQNKRLFEENMRLRKDLTQLQKQLRLSVSESASKGDRIDSLRGQIIKVQKQKLKLDESLKQITRKYKNRQEEITVMRKQLDELRQQKQKRMADISQQSSFIDDHPQDPRKPPQILDRQQKTQIQTKLDILKKQRKKEIQRLKRELL